MLYEQLHEKICIMRKQPRGNRATDQWLCFRYKHSVTPLLSYSEISSLYPSSVVVQPGVCVIWSETTKTGFLMTRPL